MSSPSCVSPPARLLWQCPVCLDTLREPTLATCCGQSFCRACLDEALRRADACPMCRAPLLSGAHATTRNRALEELLARMEATKTDVDGHDEREVLMRLASADDDKTNDDTKPPPSTMVTKRLRGCLHRAMARLRADTAHCAAPSVRFQQWRQWARIHWATLQCVFYVWLFGVFVLFLRVQEEEFAEHAPVQRLRTGGD